MFDNIFQLYEKKMILNIKHFDQSEYYYFYNEFDQLFGIKKDISKEEYLLLKSIYVQKTFYENDELTGKVMDYLFLNKGDFIYDHFTFLIMHSQINISDTVYNQMSDLLKDVFKEMLIFKKDDLIICILKEKNDNIMGIIENINSDFYVSIRVYESTYIHKSDRLLFELAIDSYKSLLQREQKYYFNLTDLLLLYIQNGDINKAKIIKEIVFKKLGKETDLIALVKIFLECNLNLSLAANSAYMHRNTFTKKIDLFIELTGFNIKEFNQAFIVKYLIEL